MAKVAIITGASRGIGRAIAKRLASENCHLLLNYHKSREAAESLKDEIRAQYGEEHDILLHQCDVSDYKSCVKMMDAAVQKWGKIDYLVNNAGISKGGFLVMNDIDNWWNVLKVNLGGTVNCSKAVLKTMFGQKSGKIINIGSLSGIKGTIGNSDYTSSKAAIHGFTKALAKEVAGFNIQVNCVAPGFFETDMTDQMPTRLKSNLKHIVPLKRMGDPSEVAEMVALLITDKINYMIGQTIVMDGGSSL